MITCLPSPAVSEKVLCGADGILAGLKRGGCWIEMSTLGRDDILRLAALAADKGVDTLESPVTGGVHRAAAGEITVLAGGDKALFETHRPALEAMGGEIFHMGPLGSAAVIKVITNMLAFIHLVAAGEALMLAKRGGLDLAQAYHAIKASSGNSFVHETESQLILNGSYNINFTMDLALKDLGFAAGFGREFGVPLDLAALTLKTFERATAAYGGGAWSTMVVKLLEDALKTDLRAPGFPRWNSMNRSPDSFYSWRRLAVSLALSTIGGVGLWSAVVVLPVIETEFAVDRGGASLPYTATMVGFAAGGILIGRFADKLGIMMPMLVGAVALGIGFCGRGIVGHLLAVRHRASASHRHARQLRHLRPAGGRRVPLVRPAARHRRGHRRQRQLCGRHLLAAIAAGYVRRGRLASYLHDRRRHLRGDDGAAVAAVAGAAGAR